MTDRAPRLARARGYPYPYPGRSYVWQSGDVTDFDLGMTEGRTAVLAVGSNRAPSRLDQKYIGKYEVPIPVQHARLKDFDIVYAAHLTRYGSGPAMLQRAPGTTVELAVTWLDDEQLEIMHATEGGYYYAEIEGVDLTYDDGTRADSVNLDVGSEGHLVHEAQPVALIESDGEDRPRASCVLKDHLLGDYTLRANDHGDVAAASARDIDPLSVVAELYSSRGERDLDR